MAKHELITYVERALKKGLHVKKIKRKLVHAGHPIHEIEDAVRHVLLTKPHLKYIRYKIFAGIFLLFAIVLLLGYLFAFEKSEELVEYKENVTFSDMSDLEILQYAKLHQSTEMCKYVRGESAYYACEEQLWKSDDCFYDLLIGQGDECFLHLAELRENPILCRRIRDDLTRDKCVDFLVEKIKNKKEPSLCGDSPECLVRYGEAVGLSLELCALIGDSGLPREGDECLLNLSVQDNDPSPCESINQIDIKIDCVMSANEDPLKGLADYCSIILIDEELEEDVFFSDHLSGENLQRIDCFTDGAISLVWKDFYSCKDLLEAINGLKGSYPYLSSFEEYFTALVRISSQELNETDDWAGCEI